MAEPELSQEGLDAVVVQEIVRDWNDDDSYDREQMTNDGARDVLEWMGTLSPVLRANAYAFMSMQLTTAGTESMTDVEPFLLGWAPQDHDATRAVENKDEGIEANVGWYNEYVSYHGSQEDARDAIMEADGWQEPGLGGRMLRFGGDLLNLGFIAQEGEGNPQGMATLTGRKVGADDSRIADLLDMSLIHSRQDIANMRTGGDKVFVAGYMTGETILEVLVVGKILGSGWRAIKSGSKIGNAVINNSVIQKILASEKTAKISRFFRGIGQEAKFADRVTVSQNLGKNTFTQNMALLSYRSGVPAAQVLERQALRQFGGVFGSGLNFYGKRAAQVAGTWMVFSDAGDIISGATMAEQYDATWADRRAKNLVRDEGLSESEAEAQAFQEMEYNAAQAVFAPPSIEYDSEKEPETIGGDVTGDSTATTMLSNLLTEVENLTADTAAKVQKANEYEAKIAYAEMSGRSAFTDKYGEAPPPKADPTAVDAILAGDADPTDYEEFLTASELIIVGVMEELGLEFYDPDTMNIEEINEAGGYEGVEGWSLTEDITAPKSAPREILLPPNISAPQFGAYVEQWNDSEIEDPLIRVPEGYSAITFAPTIHGRTYGYLDDQSGAEAAFIAGMKRTEVKYQRTGEVPATFRESMVLNQINQMSWSQVTKFQDLAAKAGFYGTSHEPFTKGWMTEQDQEAVSIIMGQANVDGETFWEMAEHMAAAPGKYREVVEEADAGATYVKEPYSIPLSLRSIPGPKTIAEDVKARFAAKLGREPLQSELDAVATDLTGGHSKQNQELIALDMARYAGDNQGLITGAQFEAVENPGAAASFDIGEKWEDEINLNERREANSDSFSRMLNATMGGRSSIGGASAAGNVQTIGRME
jgi:hypothetical protein